MSREKAGSERKEEEGDGRKEMVVHGGGLTEVYEEAGNCMVRRLRRLKRWWWLE